MLIEQGLVGVAPDLVAAANWYAKAAEQQHTRAEASLGRLYYEAAVPELKDTSSAVHFLHRAAVKVSGRAGLALQQQQ
jgi:TPR repeat protein